MTQAGTGHLTKRGGAALLVAAIVAVALGALLASAPAAEAGKGPGRTFAPKGNKLWHGTSDTGASRDLFHFKRQVGAHPALLQNFFHWGVPLSTGALDRWARTDTRGVLSLSTAPGGGEEVITMRQIAQGRSDHYMLRLNASIGSSGQVVYIRPFAEMNHYSNPYSAFNSDGSSRGGTHSTRAYKQAWRRLVTIVRGGSRARVNKRLTRLGMPRIHRAKSERDRVYRRREVPKQLDRPKVAFMWMPLTRSNPDISANKPQRYFPGGRYVDWVGTDAYAAFHNRTLWTLLRQFYARYDRWPFAIGEYAAWDGDPNAEFTKKMFKFAQTRKRVKALIYFRSNDTQNEFNLQYYPDAQRAMKRLLNGKRWQEYAPGSRRKVLDKGGPGRGGGNNNPGGGLGA